MTTPASQPPSSQAPSSPPPGWRRAAATLSHRLPAPLARRVTDARVRLARSRARSESPTRPAWSAEGFTPWTALEVSDDRRCNICRWQGERFEGPAHSEAAMCPRCGSIARDRFLFWALQQRVPAPTGEARLRVLETSPRLDERYRRVMAGWFDYLSSDYDERAHAGAIRLDLQAIDLPADSIDVILTPHVLEHVPDTAMALHELQRVLRPGGWLLLQVPILQERTAPPQEPEFHGDDTPVFWRFGPELGERLRSHGFEVELLATQPLLDAAGGGADRPRPWPQPESPEFDVDGVLRGLRVSSASPDAPLRPELVATADARGAACFGFEPAYMFLTWAARKALQR